VVGVAVAGFYRDLEASGDRLWEDWLGRVEDVRHRLARFIGAAEPGEIAFVPNTSTGINLIADLLEKSGPVLTDELEFPTVTLPWIHRGVPVHFVPSIEGLIRIESFSPEYAPKAATIVLSHVQFWNGCRLDLEAFGKIKAGRSFVVCSSQSTGAFPIDVREAEIDALASAGHKWLCAGYGAGFVYVKRALFEQHAPHAVGWLSMQDPFAFDNVNVRLLPSMRRTELGCPPFGAIFALGAAIDLLAKVGVAKISERVLHLNEYLTFRLEQKGFPILSPGGQFRSGQTLVEVRQPAEAVAFLKEKRILVTEKPEGVRVATHFYNSEEDCEALVRALVEYARAGV
jgi:selenocysteine lyase/cysteine desulfurase